MRTVCVLGVCAAAVTAGEVGLDAAGNLQPVNDDFYHDVDDTTITVGDHHACVLEYVEEYEVGGEIMCWGLGLHGELDAPEGIYVQLSAGHGYTCAVGIDKSITCWGDTPFDPPSTKEWLQVSAGTTASCGVKLSGRVECWGDPAVVRSVPRTEMFVQVSVGMNACGLKTDGQLVCWGKMRMGSAQAPEGQFVQISAAESGNTCGIDLDGNMVCWGPITGANNDGVFNKEGDFVQVVVGADYLCGINAMSQLQCNGGYSRLFKSRMNPRASIPREKLLEVSGGPNSMCGVTFDAPHKVLCWGHKNIVANMPVDLEPAV